MIDVPVLIAGGGPVGLSASMLLSRHGVRSLLVERHPGTSLHPKARGINARTMEIFRQCGVEEAVRAAGLPRDRYQYIVWAETLAGRELERRTYGKNSDDAWSVTPAGQCLCSQDALEPTLRRAAEGYTLADVRFGWEMTGFEQDDSGVTATLLERSTGRVVTARAAYLIAADGARSHSRESLGVPLLGHGILYHGVNILARVDLRPWIEDRPAPLYFIEGVEKKGTFATVNGTDRWVFLGRYDPAKGERLEDFTAETSVDVIRAAVGSEDIPVEIIGVAGWVAAARVAERFRVGRVFFAGDAAHEMPPTGGFGMNTGIQDAHNLAWKLAGVLQGWAGPNLLDTYDAERRPVDQAITEQSLQNSVSMGRIRGQSTDARFARQEYLNERGMIYGSTYDSAAIVPDGSPPPEVADPITDYAPTARPGSRAPHLWLERDATRLSTLDMCGHRFTLLTGAEGGAWRGAAYAIGGETGTPLAAHTIGVGGDVTDPTGRWADLYGVAPNGAVLVRPDGYVGWRSSGMTGQPADVLRRALGSITGKVAEGAGLRRGM